MNILAVFGSNHGQTEAVVRRVAAALEGRGHAVRVLKGDAIPPDARVEAFDAVVVGASIVVGRHQAYIVRFVQRHLDALRDRPGAFISINGANPESMPGWRAEADRYVAQFLQRTGWTPRWTAAFSGALRYPRYGWVTRWVMRAISRSQGGPTDTSREYEFTDWGAVDRFAQAVADGLAAPGAADVSRPDAPSAHAPGR